MLYQTPLYNDTVSLFVHRSSFFFFFHRNATTGHVLPPLHPAAEEGSAAEKYVLRSAAGDEVEMVAMAAPGVHGGWSLCVSSQVGCRMGCAFCETGRMNLLRHLSAAEIVSQVALASLTLRLTVCNVIFMGMGEPLDNVDAVTQASSL